MANETANPNTGETCVCGRRRYTVEDLKRWNKEIQEHERNHTNGSSAPFNPDWAKEMCWTVAGVNCNMKKVTTT